MPRSVRVYRRSAVSVRFGTPQHGIAEGGLTERLAILGITNAPPDWAGAWDAIRSATVDALTVIRQELRRSIDTARHLVVVLNLTFETPLLTIERQEGRWRSLKQPSRPVRVAWGRYRSLRLLHFAAAPG